MSMKATKEQLKDLLSNPEMKVIALSGKWGTGKSHLWEDVQKEMGLKARYASLFGLPDVQQLKLKLVQKDLAGAVSTGGKVRDALGKIIDFSLDVSGSSVIAGGVANLALTLLPKWLKGQLLVIDDLERRNAKFEIDQLLGFIDEFTKQHDCRFLLILNEEHLGKDSVLKDWEEYKEKVIDHELRLHTTSEEACEIAYSKRKVHHSYQAVIQEAVIACGITNIRVIQKVIQTVERLLGDGQGLSDQVLKRMIPSIVLLAGTYLKGIQDGPPADYIIRAGTPFTWTVSHARQDKQADEAELQQKEKWNAFLRSVGIEMADDFEAWAWRAIKDGMVDTTKIDALIEEYRRDEQKWRTEQAITHLFDGLMWDFDLSEDEIRNRLDAIRSGLGWVDPYALTNTVNLVDCIEPSLSPVADAMVKQWVELRRAANKPVAIEVPDTFNRICHPDVMAYREEWIAVNKEVKPLELAWGVVAQHNGWNQEDAAAIEGASVEDYKSKILTLNPKDRERFMRVCVQRAREGGVFPQSLHRFKQALRELMADDQVNDRMKRALKYFCGNLIEMEIKSLDKPYPS